MSKDVDVWYSDFAVFHNNGPNVIETQINNEINLKIDIKIKDKYIEELKNTISVLNGEVEELKLYMQTITNFNNQNITECVEKSSHEESEVNADFNSIAFHDFATFNVNDDSDKYPHRDNESVNAQLNDVDTAISSIDYEVKNDENILNGKCVIIDDNDGNIHVESDFNSDENIKDNWSVKNDKPSYRNVTYRKKRKKRLVSPRVAALEEAMFSSDIESAVVHSSSHGDIITTETAHTTNKESAIPKLHDNSNSFTQCTKMPEKEYKKFIKCNYEPIIRLIENTNKMPWNKETWLVVGDSTLLGVQEKKMGSKFKVRAFSGANISDLYFYLLPLLQKKPKNIIIMAGTNDAIEKDADTIVNELMQIKWFVEVVLPGSNVTLSCATMRVDNDTAGRNVFDLRKKLINMHVPLILNENIVESHLGHKGLHLNGRGAGRLAMNYLSHVRKC